MDTTMTILNLLDNSDLCYYDLVDKNGNTVVENEDSDYVIDSCKIEDNKLVFVVGKEFPNDGFSKELILEDFLDVFKANDCVFYSRETEEEFEYDRDIDDVEVYIYFGKDLSKKMYVECNYTPEYEEYTYEQYLEDQADEEYHRWNEEDRYE